MEGSFDEPVLLLPLHSQRLNSAKSFNQETLPPTPPLLYGVREQRGRRRGAKKDRAETRIRIRITDCSCPTLIRTKTIIKTQWRERRQRKGTGGEVSDTSHGS